MKNENKLALVEKARALIKRGTPVKSACEEAGIKYSTYMYYAHKKVARRLPRGVRRTKKPTLTLIPEPVAIDRIVALIGPRAQILDAVRAYV